MARPLEPDTTAPPAPPQPGRRSRDRVAILVLALPIMLQLVLCVTAPFWLRWVLVDRHGGITRRSELQKLPEEHLYYPGATLVNSFGNDYEWGIWGHNSASSGHTLGADASKEEVFAFYDRELGTRGWQKVQVGGVGSDEITQEAWRKDGTTLLISILRKHDPRTPSALDAYQTAYRMMLFPPGP